MTGLLDIGVYLTGIDHVSEAVAVDFRAATFTSIRSTTFVAGKHLRLLTNFGNAIEAAFGPHERQG